MKKKNTRAKRDKKASDQADEELQIRLENLKKARRLKNGILKCPKKTCEGFGYNSYNFMNPE